MVDLNDMALFAAVVREGGFTAAARTLGITKQTVSERISKLEAELGVRLLMRTTRSLRTTDAGAAYYEHCAAIVMRAEDANREVQREQLEPSGILRVTAPLLYGRRYLGPVIAEFLERYPRAKLDLMLVDRRVNLVEEGFDLAIRIGELDDSSLTARKLGPAFVYFVASPAYLERYGTPESAEDIRRAHCIVGRAGEVWELSPGERVKPEPTLIVNNLETACDAALRGMGVTRIPSILCEEHVRAGRLQLLFGGRNTNASAVFAVYPTRQYVPPKVRLFVELLVERIAPMEPMEAGKAPAMPHRGKHADEHATRQAPRGPGRTRTARR